MVLFLTALAFVAYVMAGYPLVLALWSRLAAKPVQKSSGLKTVSIVIAVYNGAQFLRQKLNSILALDYPRDLLQVIVVSDGSTDDTEEICRQLEHEGVQLIRTPRAGKPAALNLAIPRCKGEILVLTDVRQQLEPASLRRMVACFADPTVGVVSGEMIIRSGTKSDQANIGLYWKYESWIRDSLGKIDSMFGATGPFYGIRRELAVHIPPDILLDDVYLPMTAFFRGYRLIVEKGAVAIDYPTSLKVEFGRKVRTLAGNYQIITKLPGLLGPANRMWFHFLSYKVGRLLMPHALIALAISSFFLPGRWATAAVATQALFYASAALDGIVPEKTLLKRISSPACTFVTMMAAVVCALSVFFVDPRSLWKDSKIVAVPEISRRSVGA
jgi:cellulose synthase/poly-beta-1,6-N-acetylglucosamine synthase-like glycosyltransferase